MSTAFQPAPPRRQQQPDAASGAAEQAQINKLASGDVPPPVEPSPVRDLEARLANDERAKAKLRTLVLVLPLAVLIFGEALRFPKQDIELPIIKLKLAVEQVLPLFLLILSHMLHRALRYARIVLWSILESPAQLTEAANISLDDTEDYKTGGAQYEDVLDPMVTLLAGWRWATARLFARISFVTFNVVVAFVVYGLILLMLAVMAYHASASGIDLAVKWQITQFRLHWPIDAEKTIDILVLCVSAILLGLAWLNAAWIVMMPAAAIGVAASRAVLAFIGLTRRALRSGSPSKLILSVIVSRLIRLREQHRDRVLARDMQRFDNKHRDASYHERYVEDYKARRKLFDYANKLQGKLDTLKFNGFGLFLLLEDGEWDKIDNKFGFDDLLFCIIYLKIAAHRAPSEFVVWQAPRLAKRVLAIMNGYDFPFEKALASLMEKASSHTLEESETATMMMRARNAQIPSQLSEIKALQRRWERKLSMAAFRKSRFESAKEKYNFGEAASEHFAQSEEVLTELLEIPPRRGDRDWKFVTRVLNWLDHISAVRLP
jgi:hypothetical protein